MVFEGAPVQITIPTLPVLNPSPFLSDGAPSCANHSGSYATMECWQCHKAFCELCVHQIRRVGGVGLKLCPSCGGHCEAMVQEKAENTRKSRLGSWLGKVKAFLGVERLLLRNRETVGIKAESGRAEAGEAQAARDQRCGSYQSPRSQSASRLTAWRSRILSSAKAGMRSLRLPKKRV